MQATSRYKTVVVIAAGMAALLCGNCLGDRNSDCTKPYSKNPRYWQYRGEPVLLLGGSKTDHIFLLDDLKEHLDELAGVGGNYVRNTMSQREGLELKPHKRLSSGKFDLDQWNDDYWKRFANCLKWCRERQIIIQIEVWDRFDYSQDQWQDSPWRPGNNVNYTNQQTALAEQFPAPAWRDQQPFFHTIPGMNKYEKQYDTVRRFQEEFVDKMLSYSLDYDNVLYCMNNETSTPVSWGRYWMRFIKERAKKKGVEVYVTDMFDDGYKPQSSDNIRQAFDDPKAYDFMDISQVNSRTFNEAHWVNVKWLADQAGKHPRPLNNTKIYSDGELSFGTGTPVDGVERFWRNLIAGCASVRFHRPEAGIGLNDIAKACIKAARKVESEVKFWEVEPRMDLLKDRQEDEAYLAVRPGEKYILYFTDGGSVRLDLSKQEGTFALKWVNIRNGDWGGQSRITGGKEMVISAPSEGGWVAVIVKQN
ncbi:MAG: hypothetical protein JXN61_09305 [Sedimentisphaerales bacterium]|nr:hypothetical protein [Sedimentisphaerales bacterium]